MSRVTRLAAFALFPVVLLGAGAYQLLVRDAAVPQPALIRRDADAHRALSTQLGPRISRLIADRPPADRSAAPKLIALTFDDGPYPVETPLLLDTLEDLHVPATFFLIGRDAQQFPEITERIVRDGNEIANHTLTHPNLDALGPEEIKHELDGAAEVLGRFTSSSSVRTMMRPPHGRFTEATVVAAQRAGFHIILWTDDPGDWRTLEPEALAAQVIDHATAPDVVLLHSGRIATVQMLPEVVERFRKAGFTFVTAGELIKETGSEYLEHPLKLPV
jgi:peptidoglycan/xylan/chitin deacetylase (PgdA/CDA1 family)